MINEKFLPIGTVIMLKGGKKRTMITGFRIYSDDNKEKIYDYCGCLYPEGVLSSTKTLLFNHDNIEKIYYLGYSDEEEKEFKKTLNSTISNL